MEFLAGLKEALSLGLTKDQFMAEWNRDIEMKMQLISSTENIVTEDFSPLERNSEEVCGEKDIQSLLIQVAKQQNKIQQQQNIIHQQIKDLQVSQVKEQQTMRQQFENVQSNLSEKVNILETTLVSLHQSLTDSLRKSGQPESCDIQEKLSLMTETMCNHMVDEIRNAFSKMAESLNKTQIKSVGKNENQGPSEYQRPCISEVHDIHYHDLAGIEHKDNKDGADSHDSVKTHPSETAIKADKDTNDSFFSDLVMSDTVKNMLQHQLNCFLVKVQQMLVKPRNSEDISVLVTDIIKELLQNERIVMTDQLFSVQSAISADVQARIYKLEMSFKQELDRIACSLEDNEHYKFQLNRVLEEIHGLKGFLCSELPGAVVSHPGWASVFKSNFNVHLAKSNISEVNSRCDSSQNLEQFGRSDLILETDDFRLKYIQTEQMQTLVLMLSMYVLLFLAYHDTLSWKTNLGKPESSNEVHLNPPSVFDTTNEYLSTETASSATETQTGKPSKDLPKQLTDAHMKLLFGQHKPAQYLCEINYKKLALEEKIIPLKDIAPGYNLQLKASTFDNGNLNLHIQSAVGKLDENLIWPADFNVTVTILERGTSAAKLYNWQSFTKTKTLYKPTRSTGHSIPTPFCFFRTDVINKCLQEDTLVLKISVSHIRPAVKEVAQEC